MGRQAKLYRPRHRSGIHLKMGSAYFTYRRFLKWLISPGIYAKTQSGDLLDAVIFDHQSLLRRKLKDVDMYLQENKIVNLGLAIQKINGIIIYPGETFSYWKLIGKPSKAKGYLKGMILSNGGFKTGTGGGLCQLSNLIYWMTLHTPLTVTERYRHEYDVFPDSGRTLPFGSGATCHYNYIDLQIRNHTSQAFQLCLHMDETYLYGKWLAGKQPEYTYEVYEKNHLIRQEYWGGYTRHNTIFRKIYDPEGVETGDEYITENHAVMMYEPLLPSKKIVL